MRTCPSCGRESPVEFAFCPYCSAPLGEPEHAPVEVRKTVTMLFADVTGSTALGERTDPESMRRVMGRYFDGMRAVLERHGGTVEKFIGDAVMAVFGVPTLHEDDALRAVRAAAEMRDTLHLLNKELERDFGVRIAVRTGVNTGEVVAAQGGSRAEHLVTGEAVNVAARLEQAAAPGEILIGESTYRLVRDAVEAEPVEPLTLKGKAEPVAARRLALVHPLAAGVARRLDSPMVGRDRQLRQLTEAFESAVADRACYLFTVLGSAGVGKSRLVEEFLASVANGATALRGRCLSYGEGITYWPVAEAVAQAAGVGEIHGPDEARARLLGLLEPDDEAPVMVERLLQIIGVLESVAPTQETFWAVRRLFESMARQRPLVVVIDDIHWAEPTLLDLIEHVADWTRDAPILLVCPARPELLDCRPGWGGGKLNATTILLEPLSAGESDQLVANLLGQAELEETARARVTEAAEGNPLFVEQMLAMLIDDGFLTRQGDRWVGSGDSSTVAVPPTVQALLAARLDRLGPEERDVIACAAVEGKEFHREAVESLLPEAVRPRAAQLLQSLVRRELVRPGRGTFAGREAYRFRHQLIRDAAYEAIPKGERAGLHGRFAGWLESVAGEHAQEYEEFVGYHLEQAFRYRSELGPVDETDVEGGRRAGSLLASAGRRAVERGDARAAKSLLERAVTLLPGPSAPRILALVNLGQALFAGSDMAGATRVLGEAIEEARTIGDRRLELRAELERWQVRNQSDPGFSVDAADAFAHRAIAELQELEDDEGLAHAWRLAANAPWARAKWSQMREPLERGIEFARRAGNAVLERWLDSWWTATLYWGETPVREGIQRVRERLEGSKVSPEIEMGTRRVLGAFLSLLGDFDEAREHLARARRIGEEMGMTTWLATQGFQSGPLELLAGDPVAAEREMRPGVEELQRIGERGWLSSLAPILGEALYQQGRYDEAVEFAEVGREASNPDDASAQFIWRALAAKVLARRGELDDAERLAREGVDFAMGTDEVNHQGHAYMDLAEVLRLAGRSQDAADAVRHAIERYDLKGATVSATRARELLTQLGG